MACAPPAHGRQHACRRLGPVIGDGLIVAEDAEHDETEATPVDREATQARTHGALQHHLGTEDAGPPSLVSLSAGRRQGVGLTWGVTPVGGVCDAHPGAKDEHDESAEAQVGGPHEQRK